MPLRYISASKSAAQLDNKAWQDMEWLEEYLQQYDLTEAKVVLVGFDDPTNEVHSGRRNNRRVDVSLLNWG